MSSDFTKPTKKTKSFYNYAQVRDYLQAKYGYNERKVPLPETDRLSNHPEVDQYGDFWYWLVCTYDISNGCFVTFSRDQLPEIQGTWVKEIYKHYLDEFADDDGILEMWVWW